MIELRERKPSGQEEVHDGRHRKLLQWKLRWKLENMIKISSVPFMQTVIFSKLVREFIAEGYRG